MIFLLYSFQRKISSSRISSWLRFRRAFHVCWLSFIGFLNQERQVFPQWLQRNVWQPRMTTDFSLWLLLVCSFSLVCYIKRGGLVDHSLPCLSDNSFYCQLMGEMCFFKESLYLFCGTFCSASQKPIYCNRC